MAKNTTPKTLPVVAEKVEPTTEEKMESTQNVVANYDMVILTDIPDTDLASLVRNMVLTNGNGKVIAEYGRAPWRSFKSITQGGHNHQFGNVPQSGRSGDVKKQLAAAKGGDSKAADFDGKAVTAWGKANAEAFEQLLRKYEAKELEDFYTGKIGVRAMTPRMSDFDKAVHEEVRLFIDGQLKNHKPQPLAWPPKDDSEVITFANGVTRTFSQLFEKAYESQGERLRTKVRAKMEREEAERAAEMAAIAPTTDGAPVGI